MGEVFEREREFHAAIPANFTLQPFAKPRTGTKSPTCDFSVTCCGFLGGLFAIGEALLGGNLKDA